jgi:hypothetical protein
MSGDASRALDLAAESYHLYAAKGDLPGVASSGIIFGIAKTVAGQTEDGPKLIIESLERFRALGDAYGTVIGLIAIGEGVRSEGDEATAETYYDEALQLLGEIGDTYWPGHLLQNIAHFRLHQGDWKSAAKLASEALAISEQYDYPMVVNLAVAAISGVLLAKGDLIGSARMIGAVDARLKRLGAQFEPTDNSDFQRIWMAARDALGEKQFSCAILEGAALPWEDVLAVAHSSKI